MGCDLSLLHSTAAVTTPTGFSFVQWMCKEIILTEGAPAFYKIFYSQSSSRASKAHSASFPQIIHEMSLDDGLTPSLNGRVGQSEFG